MTDTLLIPDPHPEVDTWEELIALCIPEEEG